MEVTKMKMVDIKRIAKRVGCNPGRLKKADLIKKIQEAEGNFPCFQTAGDYCNQEKCSWRDDCLKN